MKTQWDLMWRNLQGEGINPKTTSPSSGGVAREPPSHYPFLLPTHPAIHTLENRRPRNGGNKMRDDSSQLCAEGAGE